MGFDQIGNYLLWSDEKRFNLIKLDQMWADLIICEHLRSHEITWYKISWDQRRSYEIRWNQIGWDKTLSFLSDWIRYIRWHLVRLDEKLCDNIGWDERVLYKLWSNPIGWFHIQYDMISKHQMILQYWTLGCC